VREPLTTIQSRPIGRRLAGAVDVHLTLDGRRDLSGEIYRQLRASILEGRLRPGDRLPPTRELAHRLGVSRTTTSVAFDRLISEGLATARTGAGTFVGQVGALPARADRGAPSTATVDQALRPQRAWEHIPLPSYNWGEAEFDFRGGVSDVRHFPFRTWRRLIAEQFQPEAVGRGVNDHPAGQAPLRAAIAHHVGLARGIRSNADDVVVTNGTQQALDLIGRVLLRPGDQVAFEDPGYGPPYRLLRAMGFKPRGVPVDREGLVVDAIPAGTRLAYVTPAHHLPMGMTMSLPRRLALLEWARRNDAAIIEDDYDSEFRFGGRPIEPLHTLDDSGRVIYVGSFTKTTLATLRLGFIIAPPSLREALQGAKFLTDWHSPVPLQAALAEFIAAGHFARHVRRMRLVYEARHGLITEILRRRFAGRLEVIPSAAGLHICATAPDLSVDQIEAVIKRAAALGVAIHPLSLFALDEPPSAGLVLAYGAIPTDRIEEGLDRLHRAMARVR
jgi:GntR family transcriptional regulator / MocR family aminotransferase